MQLMRGDQVEAGQSLLELAIVLPLLALIVIGALDLGRAFFTVIVISNASREGARYLVLHPLESTGAVNYSGTEAAAVAEATGSFVVVNSADVDASCTDADGNGCDSGGTAIVTVEVDFYPLLGLFIPSPLNLFRTTEMYVP